MRGLFCLPEPVCEVRVAWCIKPAGTAFLVTSGPVLVIQMLSLVSEFCLRSYVTWALLIPGLPVGAMFRARDLNVDESYLVMCQ